MDGWMDGWADVAREEDDGGRRERVEARLDDSLVTRQGFLSAPRRVASASLVTKVKIEPISGGL